MLSTATFYGDNFTTMADGLNEARALRITELMNDFRTLLLHISQLKTDAPQGEEHEEGYAIMRQCFHEVQGLISAQFNVEAIQNPNGDGEWQKVQLQRIILDASARRFQAHKIYLRMAAARRWAMSRMKILQGQKPNHSHLNALRAIDQTLRNELSSFTDPYIRNDLMSADVRAGHWLSEDPDLSIILHWFRTHS
ncbi:uncharacterized protein CIMG_03828 [Coccidioides immitis RS]|uniref:Uncharacterized protein n=3 Tax=Coccidioides immitis TaxID=5501 RepID=A0A0D8JWQ8_COCIM|nr:uncharacterized protein CIMG_03828 [Coccidioides immitis RS]KJF61569.1 hypothetical protein CIMG_03828 [Coccidioides immitis RS]KMP08073.1 hypothetical protein CIRG_07754 [Coccidioides immitis RMSCC 2394]KMU82155.1 hypothetical protein CIHG_10474 [Coccidioides immitis H538.4]